VLLQAMSRADICLQCSDFSGSKILLHIVAIVYGGNLSLGLYTEEILKWKMVAIYRLIK
jgi:hypothetical protein